MGISTPCYLEAKTGAPTLDIIASGGIILGFGGKAVALGAKAVGIAGLAAKVLLLKEKRP